MGIAVSPSVSGAAAGVITASSIFVALWFPKTFSTVATRPATAETATTTPPLRIPCRRCFRSWAGIPNSSRAEPAAVLRSFVSNHCDSRRGNPVLIQIFGCCRSLVMMVE